MLRHRSAINKTLLVAGIVLFSTACGQTKMVAVSKKMRQLMQEQNHVGALSVLRKSKNEAYDKKDQVVYQMEEGMLLHLTGDYKGSNKVLDIAEGRTKELFTKSIGKGIKAAFSSDAATDYPGEDYEKVLINVVKAFNYLGMNEYEGAMVEARKINEKLKWFNTKYDKKNVYSQDAFALWLTGRLFEMEGTYDEARIAYSNALKVYTEDFSGNYGMKVPSYVAEDLARAAMMENNMEELEKLRGIHGAEIGNTAEMMKSKGEVVLFHLNGEGPTKSDYMITCWFLSAANWRCDGEPGGKFMKKTKITIPSKGTVMKIAFPEIHVHLPPRFPVQMKVGGAVAATEIAYPLSEIAVKTLQDKTGRIWKDAIVRAITKTLTSAGAGAVAGKAGGKMFGWLAKTATSAVFQALEEADKRTWSTLPARIDVARAFVEPGTHDLMLELPNGKTAMAKGIKVEPGKRAFVTLRTLPPPSRPYKM